MNNAREKVLYYHDVVIKRNTPEECAGSISMLANAIEIRTEMCRLNYSSVQGKLLSQLRDLYGRTFN